MSCSTGWGDEPWGAGPWGGGPGAGPLQIASVLAVRENVIRVEFTEAVSYTNIKDPSDGSLPSNWRVEPNPQSIGANGESARPVMVVEVLRPDVDDVPLGTLSKFLDLVLDRPMTPYPAFYRVIIVGAIFTQDLAFCLQDVSVTFPAIYRELQRPTLVDEVGSRDLANAQSLGSVLQSLTETPGTQFSLGTYQVGADGDYAFDSGNVNLKKRIVRRVFTKKGGFSWLLNYGVGIDSYGKQLGRANTITKLTTDIETQIKQEPDVERARVRVDITNLHQGLLKLFVFIKPRTGQPMRFDFPVPIKG